MTGGGGNLLLKLSKEDATAGHSRWYWQYIRKQNNKNIPGDWWKKDACEEATMNVSGTGKDEKLASKQNEKWCIGGMRCWIGGIQDYQRVSRLYRPARKVKAFACIPAPQAIPQNRESIAATQESGSGTCGQAVKISPSLSSLFLFFFFWGGGRDSTSRTPPDEERPLNRLKRLSMNWQIVKRSETLYYNFYRYLGAGKGKGPHASQDKKEKRKQQSRKKNIPFVMSNKRWWAAFKRVARLPTKDVHVNLFWG